MDEENTTPPPVPSKVLALVGIFVVSLAAAYLPSASEKVSALRLPGRTLFYARHFGTGVILSTAFTHLLGAAFTNLQNVRWLGYKHWAGLFVMLAVIGIFLVEYASNAYLQAIAAQCESGSDDAKPHNQLKPNGQSNGSSGETTPLLENGSDSDTDFSATARATFRRRERLLGVLILQVGIMLHSFVIGLTLGVAPASAFGGLVPAIFFHQLFEGIALGARLASLRQPPSEEGAEHSNSHSHSHHPHDHSSCEGPRPNNNTQPDEISTFRPTKWERLLPPVLSVLFALPIPLLLFISLFVPALQAQATSSSLFSSSHYVISLPDMVTVAATRSEVMQGVTSGISAGLLIYVACVELLAGDFLHNTELQRSNMRIQGGAVLSFVAGAVGMSLI